MGVLRPLPMAKIGVLGLKEDREALLATLHDLGVVQVEPVGKATLEQLGPERTSDLQRTVSDQLIRFRGLKAALPATPFPNGRSFRTLEEIFAAGATVPIDAEVGELKREEDHKLTERAQVDETLALLQRFGFYQDRLEYLNARSLLAFFGEAPAEPFQRLQADLPGLSNAAQFLTQPAGDSTLFVLAVPTAQAEAVGHLAQQRGIRLFPVPKLAGTPAEERPRLQARRAALDQRLGEIRARLTEISRQWYGTVVHVEEALTIENRKLEIYPKLAAGRSSFAVEGWVPKRDLPRLEATLQAASRGRVELYDIPTSEEPPTFLENPPGVRWYEFFIRFYSLPQATEWDPTFVFALVFPLLFGLMLGDVGYAVVILGFCLWMIGGFPGGQHLPKSLTGFLTNIMGASSMRKLAYALVPGTLVGIAVGVLTNSYFGFSLPYTPVFTPLNNTGTLLLFAGFLGLGMVLLG
ncbi:MAG TPA: V-type ATPase 116kDa subunit family protein, partial [Thermoplasmata archaeon]|nr:V-type ATPase 116kDa subunit family protein [Thermoplasmata archaeon]